MSWWYTPLGFIIPLTLFLLPAIIYRFAILKKPLQKKKATIVTIIYSIVYISSLAIISKEDAFLHCFLLIYLSLVNCAILVTSRNKPILRMVFTEMALHLLLDAACIAVFFILLSLGFSYSALIISFVIVIIPYHIFSKRIVDWCEYFFIKSENQENNFDKNDIAPR